MTNSCNYCFANIGNRSLYDIPEIIHPTHIRDLSDDSKPLENVTGLSNAPALLDLVDRNANHYVHGDDSRFYSTFF